MADTSNNQIIEHKMADEITKMVDKITKMADKISRISDKIKKKLLNHRSVA
jgi:hypothetical protein